jgi:tRNA(Ile)-lysidine synthase
MVVDAVRQQCERLGLDGAPLLVAVSGGIDSLVLLHALLELTRGSSLKLSIGHVNHGLRGPESQADQEFVEDLARKWGVPANVREVAPGDLREGTSSRLRPTLQEACRTLRYAALREMAVESGCAQIATAHTLDDQAETVLLRLMRGSGPDGLGGIPERSADGILVRPLLRVSRAQIADYAEARGIRWREDASNASPEYARNRLRLHWLPGLIADFNPQLLMAIGDLAEAHRTDAEWIDALVEQQAAVHFREDQGWMQVIGDDWQAMPDALARRLVRWGLRACGVGREASRTHIERMLAFLRDGRSGSHIELPGGVRLHKDRTGTRLGPVQSPGTAPWGGTSAC